MKNYKTLANAYAAGIKREFAHYDLNNGYDLLDDILAQRGYTKTMRTVALVNVMTCVDLLARDNGADWEDIFVLKQTDKGFEWDRVGMIEHDDEGEHVMFDKPKAKKTVSRAYDPAQEYEDLMEGYKPRTRKPTTAKGSAKMTKKEVRSWAWKQANGDRAKYDELCKSKGVDNHR